MPKMPTKCLALKLGKESMNSSSSLRSSFTFTCLDGNFPLVKAFVLQAMEKNVLEWQWVPHLWTDHQYMVWKCCLLSFPRWVAWWGDESTRITKPGAHVLPSAALQILSDPTPPSSVTFKDRKYTFPLTWTQLCAKDGWGDSLLLEIKYYDFVSLKY